MDTNISGAFADDLILRFHKAIKKPSLIYHLRLILIRGQIIETDLELTTLYSPNVVSFQRLVSASLIEKNTVSGKVKVFFNLNFEVGRMSLSFDEAFFIQKKEHRNVVLTEDLPKELAKRLRNQTDE